MSRWAGGISIHAPLAGCDFTIRNLSQTEDISIHAPLAGCDTVAALVAAGD